MRPDAIRRRFLATAAASAAAGFLPRLALSMEGKPRRLVVEIEKLRFHPQRIEARIGDTVTWINRDIAPHTATARGDAWDTGKLAKGESAILTVTREMAGEYYCRFHPAMKGELVVSEEPD